MACRFDALIATGTLPELYEVNLDFHCALLCPCGSTELVNLVDALRRRTSSAPATQWQTSGYLEQSAREHHDIVAAAEGRDAAGLKRAIGRHIRKPERRLPDGRHRSNCPAGKL